ncbi:hypothetical protein HRI_000411700 [Hibiscus trionum]|uniref:Reverse transcriptase domain-containing protein n=1 Tax=Hibiscus trionum TaxID=183268 RepID=A0A9W7GXY3_HIBTR|nr:hypothetical protein HRI_000411700 [Hibiscus trionum]
MENCNDFDKKIKEMVNRINEIENMGDSSSLCEELLKELTHCNLVLWDSLKAKEDIWRQKSRINWLKNGDGNTAFFHKAVKFRCKRKLIMGANVGIPGENSPAKLRHKAYKHFKDHFNSKRRNWSAIFDIKFSIISEDEAKSLESPFSMTEIKEAVWSRDDSKAPGPGGFNSLFFKKSWNLIHKDIERVLEKFYNSGKLESNMNSSFLTLIPKTPSPSNISDYRPISLISSLYKIVSKVLSRRISNMMSKVISDTQCAFIRGRQIFDGILIANEIIHSLKSNTCSNGGVILKLDFSKAFDCVRWDFLDMILEKMGFGPKWRGWISECVSTAKVSILLNGTPTMEFKMKRGLRQGDPLSPFLFIIVTEALHKLLDTAEVRGAIKGIKIAEPLNSITHLQFADDTILFFQPEKSYLKNVKKILRCFEVCSGLSINFKKSGIAGVGTHPDTLNMLATTCGCSKIKLPFTYLGIPLGSDPRQIATWDPIVERCQSKLAGWKGRSLSFAGRVVLINSVLSALPLYFMSLFIIPKTVLKKIDRIRREFLWGKSIEGKPKMARVGWGRLCLPNSKGGAGIINLDAKNKALLAKWGWRFATEKEALWRKVILCKYGPFLPSWKPQIGNSKNISSIWKGIMKNLSKEDVDVWMNSNSFRWQLGDGNTILFWEDSWCDSKPLCIIYARIYRLQTRKRTTVAEMLGDGQLQDWSNLFSRPLLDRETEIVSKIKNSLQIYKVKLGVADRIIWIHETAGMFSVKKLSDLLISANIDDPTFNFEKIWKLKTPPKVKNFLWMLIIKRLPTKEFLKDRGILMSEAHLLCPWCGSEIEDIDHLFIRCNFAISFWKLFCDWWNIPWPNPNSVETFFNFCLDLHWGSNSSSPWLTCVAAAFWSIWLARNEKLFQNKSIDSSDLLFISKMRALIWCKATKPDSKLDEIRWWENPMSSILSQIYKPPINPRDNVQDGCLIFNVDGAASPNLAGCGGVLCSKNGIIKAMFSGPAPPNGSDYSKIFAINTALHIFSEAGLTGSHPLVIESDSQVVINWILSAPSRPWKWWQIFEEIDKLRCGMQVSFTHSPRIYNSMADHLAKMGLNRNSMFKSWW